MAYPRTLSEFSRGRRAAIVATLGGLWTIGPFSIDLYLPALPTLGGDLAASQQQVAVTVTAFLVGLAFGQVQAGALSDTYGRRRPLLAGLLVYTLATLACALAPTIQVLIVARFLQGLGGAAGMAISNAAVTDYVRGREAARLMSRLAMIGGVAPIIAPLAGGQLLRVMSWRGLFVVLTAIGLALLLAVLAGLPESLPRARRSSAGLGTLLTSLTALTRDARFMGFALTSALSFAGFFAYLAGSSFVYQDVYGVSPAGFSVLFAANAVGMLGASELNHRLLARFTPAQLLAAALVVNAVAGVVVLVVLLAGDLASAGRWRRRCSCSSPASASSSRTRRRWLFRCTRTAPAPPPPTSAPCASASAPSRLPWSVWPAGWTECPWAWSSPAPAYWPSWCSPSSRGTTVGGRGPASCARARAPT